MPKTRRSRNNAVYRTPEFREKISKISMKRWADPEARRKLVKGQKKAMGSLESRRKKSIITKAQWANPETREKLIQGLKSRQKYTRGKDEWTPERRANLGKIMSKLFADPEYRSKRGWSPKGPYNDYPPYFNREIKHFIKSRDGYVCALCWSPELLHVHHINYDKYDLREKNLITLCPSCHMKTNVNRDYWKSILSTYLLYGIGLLGSLLTTSFHS